MFKDHVRGGESDTGLCGVVSCPECGAAHVVHLSSLGWALYECGSALISTQVPDWTHAPGKNGSKRTDPPSRLG